MYKVYAFMMMAASASYFWRMFASRTGQWDETGPKYTLLWCGNLVTTLLLSFFFGAGFVSMLAGNNPGSILPPDDFVSRVMFIIFLVGTLVALWMASVEMDWFDFVWDNPGDAAILLFGGTLAYFSLISYCINISLFKLLVAYA